MMHGKDEADCHSTMTQFITRNSATSRSREMSRRSRIDSDDRLSDVNEFDPISLPSPTLSPETQNVLDNAERTLQDAHCQIMQINMINTSRSTQIWKKKYLDRPPLDDEDEELLYVRELVTSKFAEINDGISGGQGTNIRRDDSDARVIVAKNIELSRPKFKTSRGYTKTKLLNGGRKNRSRKLDTMREDTYWKDSLNNSLDNSLNFSNDNLNDAKDEYASTTSSVKSNLKNEEKMQKNNILEVQSGPVIRIERKLMKQTIKSVHISPETSFNKNYENTGIYEFRYETLTNNAESKETHGKRESNDSKDRPMQNDDDKLPVESNKTIQNGDPTSLKVLSQRSHTHKQLHTIDTSTVSTNTIHRENNKSSEIVETNGVKSADPADKNLSNVIEGFLESDRNNSIKIEEQDPSSSRVNEPERFELFVEKHRENDVDPNIFRNNGNHKGYTNNKTSNSRKNKENRDLGTKNRENVPSSRESLHVRYESDAIDSVDHNLPLTSELSEADQSDVDDTFIKVDARTFKMNNKKRRNMKTIKRQKSKDHERNKYYEIIEENFSKVCQKYGRRVQTDTDIDENVPDESVCIFEQENFCLDKIELNKPSIGALDEILFVYDKMIDRITRSNKKLANVLSQSEFIKYGKPHDAVVPSNDPLIAYNLNLSDINREETIEADLPYYSEKESTVTTDESSIIFDTSPIARKKDQEQMRMDKNSLKAKEPPSFMDATYDTRNKEKISTDHSHSCKLQNHKSDTVISSVTSKSLYADLKLLHHSRSRNKVPQLISNNNVLTSISSVTEDSENATKNTQKDRSTRTGTFPKYKETDIVQHISNLFLDIQAHIVKCTPSSDKCNIECKMVNALIDIGLNPIVVEKITSYLSKFNLTECLVQNYFTGLADSKSIDDIGPNSLQCKSISYVPDNEHHDAVETVEKNIPCKIFSNDIDVSKNDEQSIKYLDFDDKTIKQISKTENDGKMKIKVPYKEDVSTDYLCNERDKKESVDKDILLDRLENVDVVIEKIVGTCLKNTKDQNFEKELSLESRANSEMNMQDPQEPNKGDNVPINSIISNPSFLVNEENVSKRSVSKMFNMTLKMGENVDAENIECVNQNSKEHTLSTLDSVSNELNSSLLQSEKSILKTTAVSKVLGVTIEREDTDVKNMKYINQDSKKQLESYMIEETNNDPNDENDTHLPFNIDSFRRSSYSEEPIFLTKSKKISKIVMDRSKENNAFDHYKVSCNSNDNNTLTTTIQQSEKLPFDAMESVNIMTPTKILKKSSNSTESSINSAVSLTCSNKEGTSTDISHSEGELFLPSSCSYSLGEVKVFKKPCLISTNDNDVMVLVTKSMLTSFNETTHSEELLSLGEI